MRIVATSRLGALLAAIVMATSYMPSSAVRLPIVAQPAAGQPRSSKDDARLAAKAADWPGPSGLSAWPGAGEVGSVALDTAKPEKGQAQQPGGGDKLRQATAAGSIGGGGSVATSPSAEAETVDTEEEPKQAKRRKRDAATRDLRNTMDEVSFAFTATPPRDLPMATAAAIAAIPDLVKNYQSLVKKLEDRLVELENPEVPAQARRIGLMILEEMVANTYFFGSQIGLSDPDLTRLAELHDYTRGELAFAELDGNEVDEAE